MTAWRRRWSSFPLIWVDPEIPEVKPLPETKATKG